MEEVRKKQLEQGFDRSKIMQLFHGKIQGMSPGRFEVQMPKIDFMLRPAGMFNGTTMACLVDVSSGYAAATVHAPDSYLSTVELKINYLSPAIGEGLLALAVVIKKGRTLTVVRCDVYAQDGSGKTLVATALVTLMLLAEKSAFLQVD